MARSKHKIGGWTLILIEILLFALTLAHPVSDYLRLVDGNFWRSVLLWICFSASAIGIALLLVVFPVFLMSFNRTSDATRRSKSLVLVFIALSILLEVHLFASMYYSSPGSVSDACGDHYGNLLYFSTITLTTVGYGDCHPSNAFARTVASIEALSGFFTLGLLISSMSAIFRPSISAVSSANNPH